MAKIGVAGVQIVIDLIVTGLIARGQIVSGVTEEIVLIATAQTVTTSPVNVQNVKGQKGIVRSASDQIVALLSIAVAAIAIAMGSKSGNANGATVASGQTKAAAVVVIAPISSIASSSDQIGIIRLLDISQDRTRISNHAINTRATRAQLNMRGQETLKRAGLKNLVQRAMMVRPSRRVSRRMVSIITAAMDDQSRVARTRVARTRGGMVSRFATGRLASAVIEIGQIVSVQVMNGQIKTSVVRTRRVRTSKTRTLEIKAAHITPSQITKGKIKAGPVKVAMSTKNKAAAVGAISVQQSSLRSAKTVSGQIALNVRTALIVQIAHFVKIAQIATETGFSHADARAISQRRNSKN